MLSNRWMMGGFPLLFRVYAVIQTRQECWRIPSGQRFALLLTRLNYGMVEQSGAERARLTVV
jgi:hypothetical protein